MLSKLSTPNGSCKMVRQAWRSLSLTHQCFCFQNEIKRFLDTLFQKIFFCRYVGYQRSTGTHLSVAVLAEISFRSPPKLFIFSIKKCIYGIKVYKKIYYFILEKKLLWLARTCLVLSKWSSPKGSCRMVRQVWSSFSFTHQCFCLQKRTKCFLDTLIRKIYFYR